MVDLGMAAKVRPAVVISVPAGRCGPRARHARAAYNKCTELEVRVSVSVPFLKAGVFDAQSLVTVPHAKLIRMLGKLSSLQLAAVERGVCLWLGLPATKPDA